MAYDYSQARLPPEIIAPRRGRGSKLGNLIRCLGSSMHDGERVAIVHAIGRVLDSVGADFHAWAEHTEKGSNLNEAEAKKIFDSGYAMGVQVERCRAFNTAQQDPARCEAATPPVCSPVDTRRTP
jgi:hypothetical protein